MSYWTFLINIFTYDSLIIIKLFFKSHDFLFIGYDDEREFNRHTGKISPQTFKSTDESDLRVRFISDHKVSKIGVIISIEYIDDGKC